MNILVLGSGGREHALCIALGCGGEHHVTCAPGNAGLNREFYCLALDPFDFPVLIEACRSFEIDLVVVGPETLLAAGVVDALTDANITVFGPNQKAARVETSKRFMKDICYIENIPTAQPCAPTSGADYPVVLKEDGLAGGKGVHIVKTPFALDNLVAKLQEAGKSFFLEEFLPGREISYHVLCDGLNYATLPISRDYKELYPGGPMTGGMGAISHDNLISAKTHQQIKTLIVEPFIKGMIRQGIDYRGVLYFGLMIDEHGSPKLLEVNCRFGDPEAQAILPRIAHPYKFIEMLFQTAAGSIHGDSLAFSIHGSAVVNVVTAEYPMPSPTPRVITGFGGPHLLHCNTKWMGGDTLMTNGGRIFSAVHHGGHAVSEAYDLACHVKFEGASMRHDIGS